MIRVFESLEDVSLGRQGCDTVVAFGSFDGLHWAHRELIGRVIREARARGGLSVVLSFSNHPLSVLAPPYCPKLLLSPRRKLEILEQLGVDVAILPEFTRELARMPAERFLRECLIERIGMRHIVVGYDCRFGAEGKGDGEMLKSAAPRLGFTVEAMGPMREGGAVIGSRAIRSLLNLGRVEAAAALLLRPHELAGRVVQGDKRGRQLGFPTANLEFDPRYLIPAAGVYAIWADAAGTRYGGMINLGRRPTFGRMAFVPEAHLFSFEGDLYGQEIVVYFLGRLRGEKRFANAEALRRQLERDRQRARRALLRHGHAAPGRKLDVSAEAMPGNGEADETHS
ncbi:MAG: Riboflavin biosynthesis protein RibF [candidate division BRC1 bacterium ADurb.BinA364]|nr:MAG: Riboflavin biosynthesis protein RibF [candidate division BRC1 bacterium ADurb.BinA364]